MKVTLNDFDNEESTQKIKCLNTFLAVKLYSNIYEKPEIYEYDIQIVDKPILFQIVDKHYLLLNKIHLKEFYIYWRTHFLKHDTQFIDISTICILLINPNFLSAWSYRKSLLDKNLTKVLFFNFFNFN